MKRFIVIVVLILSPFLTFPATSHERQPINDIYTVVFILDGLNYNTFERALKNGSAPNVEKYFIDDGAYFTNALSLFPSASTTVYQAIVSGLFPGHAGIPYLGWFDRATEKPIEYFSVSGHKHLDHDLLNFKALLDPDVETLYPPSTIFDYLNGYITAAIYSSYNAGAKLKKPANPVSAFWAVFGSVREEMVDRYAFRDVKKLFKRPIKEIPRFTFVGLYSTDFFGHHFGPESSMIDYNMEQFDQFLGQFIDLLKKRSIFGKTYIVLAADHGMHSTPGSKFGLKDYVKKLGLTVYQGRRPGKNDFNTYVSSRGVATAHIYVKGGGGWKERPGYDELRNYTLKNGNKIDIIGSLLDPKEIKFAVVRDGFYKVHVFSKNGHGIITSNFSDSGDRYRYDIAEGDRDPLELESSAAKRLINKGYYLARLWSEAAADHKFPDAVVQLSQIFADGRSGDIFVVPEDSWVFYKGKAGTHGSVIKDDIHIPLLIRGPTVPAGKYRFAQATDLFPTILDWFGIDGNERHYDGRPLFKSKIQDSKSKINPRLQIQRAKLIKKLQKISCQLRQQKKDPKNYHFTPDIVLDANMWLVGEQIKRLNEDAKILLQ